MRRLRRAGVLSNTALAALVILSAGAGVFALESPLQAGILAALPVCAVALHRLLSERGVLFLLLLGSLLIPFGVRIPVAAGTSLDSALLLFQIGTMIALGMWLLRGLPLGRLSALDLLVLGYTMLILLSMAVASDKVLSIRQGYYLLNWSVLYFAVTRLFTDSAKTKILVNAVSWGLVLLALVGVVQVALSILLGVRPVYLAMVMVVRLVEGTSFNDALGVATNWITPYNTFRAIGTHNGPMSFGQAMILGLFPSIGCALLSQGRQRAICWILAGLFLLCILLSFSRGIWLAAGFGIILGCALPGVLGRHRRLQLLRVAALVCIVGAATIAIAAPKTGEMITRTIAAAVSPETSETRWARSFEVRKELYRRASEAIEERPWAGWGPGNYGLAAGLDPTRANAHNVYLQIASEMGIPALCFYLAILAYAVSTGFSLGRAGEDPRRRGLGFGLALAFCALAVHGLFDTYLTSPKVAMYFWLAVALLEGMRREQAKVAE